MLDKLFESVSGNVISQLTAQAGITQEDAEKVLPVAKETLESGLMNEVKGGNISGILDMFNTKTENLESNGLFSNLKGQLLQNLLAKAGVPDAIAGLAADTGLQSIIRNLSSILSNDGGEVTKESLMKNLDLGDIVGGLLGGNKGGIGGMLGGLFKK